jgi:hypothetical protein
MRISQNGVFSKHQPLSPSRGMGLLEYSLIGVSVLLVCIAGFTLASDSINEWLSGVKGDMDTQVANTATQKASIIQAKAAEDLAQANAAKGNFLNINTQALTASPSNPDSLCSGGWCINAPGLTGNSVYTAGSNGNQMVQLTNSAAGIYAQLAQILAAQGADAGIISLLTNMANQGHALGDAQSQFLAGGDYGNMKTGMTNYQSGLSSFQQMNQQLLSLLPQLPADTRGILQDASNVIIGIGSSYTLNLGTGGTSEIGWSFSSSNIQLTHTNSNTICTNGGDGSSCVQ